MASWCLRMGMRRGFSIAMGLLAGFAGAAQDMRAGELVTLRNGFSIQCTHHAEVDGRVRLFSSQGDDSYIEFGPEEIARVEAAPDPPEAAAPKGNAIRPHANARKARPDSILSPQDLGQMLAKAGKEHNVDIDLLASLVKAESGGNPHAVSRTGARGLMQLMPKTAAGLGVEDSFQPEQNVRGGTAYLDALLICYHDNLALALAAYNAGPAAVAKYHGIPPYDETRAYVARVIHEFNRRVKERRARARTVMEAAMTIPGSE